MRVIGYIGNFEQAKQEVEMKYNLSNFHTSVVDYKSDMDEIKAFRKFLTTPIVKEKLGIIHYLNFFSDEKQNLLLKIFEEIPEKTHIVFIATANVNYTLQTRAQIYFLNKFNEKLKNHMKNFKEKIENGTISKAHLNAANVMFNAYSLCETEFLKEQERDIILKNIGV